LADSPSSWAHIVILVNDAGMRVWIGDEANGIQAETTINRTVAARLRWPEGLTAASWLHETALRLYPDSKYAKAHCG
jgi:hypothetical protein